MSNDVINLLSQKCGIDYNNYAESSLQRRLDSFVLLNFKGNQAEFENFLQTASSDDVISLINEISVNTTEFYRDWDVWRSLKKDVLPLVSAYDTIRIWHAGCSTGEEVYSMAILAAELGLSSKIRLFATDISEKALRKARKGAFRDKIMQQNFENIREIVGLENFKRYFTIENEIWQIRFDLLPEISFQKKDLSSMNPFSKFDLILCRNVMIYFNLELQQRVIDLFSRSLFRNGFLITGKKESVKLVCDIPGFRAFQPEERIFQWN